MTTSQQWWDKTKEDPEALKDWLQKQYRGEITASRRITAFANKYASPDQADALAQIASDEDMHADWVGILLTNRGGELSEDNAEKRYWDKTLPEIASFETGAAVGAHAEAMRLERIKVIVEDRETPQDIRDIFTWILADEIRHEATFRELAGPEAMAATIDAHQEGRRVLGLEP